MSVYERIYALVRQVPPGTVATYGQIADLADVGARQVGYALHRLTHEDVPWHRVVNARGEISPRSSNDSHELQRHLLEAEGIVIDGRGRIDLRKYRWVSPMPLAVRREPRWS